MKIARNPDFVQAPIARFAHQIEITGPQRWLVLSGQTGQRVDGTVPADPVEQISVALNNVKLNLTAAGMDVVDVVKLTFYLVGDIDTAQRREVVAAWLNGHEPCMTLLFAAGLAAPAYLVEIDAWACRDNEER